MPVYGRASGFRGFSVFSASMPRERVNQINDPTIRNVY
jgi:hypothetical protein